MRLYTIRLIATLALTILAVPLATRAQQADRMKTIGVLQPYAEHDPEGQRRFSALLRGLQDLGWQEGRNVALEIRYAGGTFERLPTQVAELFQANVDLIVTAGTQPIQTARKATTRIPIVMATIGDPVGIGIVASLSRPGGNHYRAKQSSDGTECETAGDAQRHSAWLGPSGRHLESRQCER